MSDWFLMSLCNPIKNHKHHWLSLLSWKLPGARQQAVHLHHRQHGHRGASGLVELGTRRRRPLFFCVSLGDVNGIIMGLLWDYNGIIIMDKKQSWGWKASVDNCTNYWSTVCHDSLVILLVVDGFSDCFGDLFWWLMDWLWCLFFMLMMVCSICCFWAFLGLSKNCHFDFGA